MLAVKSISFQHAQIVSSFVRFKISFLQLQYFTILNRNLKLFNHSIDDEIVFMIFSSSISYIIVMLQFELESARTVGYSPLEE